MVTAATVDTGDVDMGAAVELADTGDAAELVTGGATHSVQMVLVLVLKMVERLVAFMTEVVPFATLVVVIGQLVTVVRTISVTTLATVEFAVMVLLMLEPEPGSADTALADDDGATTMVVAGLVDVTMTFDVTGVLRAGQLRTLEAQAVMMTSLVLKTVVSGITVVVDFMLEILEEIMLDEARELALELEVTVLLMALMLL